MEQDNEAKISTKDIPTYSWHTKEEGKSQYAQFAKTFVSSLKHLRYLLEPGAVARRLGANPGPAPVNAAARKEWREDVTRYEARQLKIDEHFAAALSALETSFVFASLPRHLIDKVLENPPAGVAIADWTYQAKFEACWEALRVEYQPSTAIDLSQLREQIFALNDQIPGGFDQFKSEFHRLHAEIVATRVPQAIADRELNGIVRDGIKNPAVWAFVCHPIYSVNPDAPWERTFDEVSKLLTSYRQKGFDPYGEARNAPLIGHTPIAANSAQTVPATRNNPSKRGPPAQREHNGRFQKAQKTSHSSVEAVNNHGKHKRSNAPIPTRHDSDPVKGDRKCTRCWNNSSHGYKECTETKCACGRSLSPDQVICFNYDNHPPSAQFPEKLPRSLAAVLDAYRRGKTAFSTGKSSNSPAQQQSPPKLPDRKLSTPRSNTKSATKALAAQVAEELIRRGVAGDGLDTSA